MKKESVKQNNMYRSIGVVFTRSQLQGCGVPIHAGKLPEDLWKVIDGRWARRSAVFFSKAEGLHMALEQLAVDVFCQDVRRIGLACNLGYRDVSGPESLLDPEICRGQMPDLAQASPLTNTDCRGGIGLNVEGEIDGEVLGDGLQSQSCAGPSANSRELSLGAGKRHRRLSLGVMLDAMGLPHRCSSRHRPSRHLTPSNICVDEGCEHTFASMNMLMVEAPNDPFLAQQVSHKPLEAFN